MTLKYWKTNAIGIIRLGVNFGYITQFQRDLVTIIEKLKADTNHKYLKTFRPTLEDCKAIFKTDEMAQKVFMYSESKWLTIGELPDDFMKPLDASAKLKINCTFKNLQF